MHVLEDRQPGHQPRRQRWPARLVLIDRPEPFLEKAPVGLARQLHQRIPQIDDLVETRAEHVPLPRLAPLLRLLPKPRHKTKESRFADKINLQENRRPNPKIRQNPLLHGAR